MKSLKDIKEALNSLPEDKLDKFFITHQMDVIFEDPEAKLDVIFEASEEEHFELRKIYDEDGMKVLQEFAKQVFNDSAKVCATKLDSDLEEHYCETERNFS